MSEKQIDTIGLTLLIAGSILALCLMGCSKDNPVAPQLAQDYDCEMKTCPPGSYCPQACAQ